MAINKNFVIKNGVEVNTNLLVGDSTLNKVGIATTVPGYTLHIGVGDGARGGIGVTDITVTGIATIGVANTLLGFQAGKVTTGSYNTILGYGADPSANNAENQIVIGKDATGHGDNIAVIGNSDMTAIHPADDNGVDLGSSSKEFKDLYIDGTASVDVPWSSNNTPLIDLLYGTSCDEQTYGRN